MYNQHCVYITQTGYRVVPQLRSRPVTQKYFRTKKCYPYRSARVTALLQLYSEHFSQAVGARAYSVRVCVSTPIRRASERTEWKIYLQDKIDHMTEYERIESMQPRVKQWFYTYVKRKKM